jgi:hypothetical protein
MRKVVESCYLLGRALVVAVDRGVRVTSGVGVYAGSDVVSDDGSGTAVVIGIV